MNLLFIFVNFIVFNNGIANASKMKTLNLEDDNKVVALDVRNAFDVWMVSLKFSL